MQTRRVALAAALVLTASAVGSIWSSAHAADQTVLGKSYVLKDPKPGVDPLVRSIVVLGKELLADDNVVGDPVANGATVEIVANGGTSGSQAFSLPAGAAVPPGPGWKVLSTGFSYKDALGANGAVKTALIKKSGNGTFVVKVTIKGANGPITLLPPAPGTDGGMKFTINGGDSYCVMFGGAAGGLVKNAPTNGTPNKLFKVVGNAAFPTTETGCPVPPPPTTSTSSSTSSSSTVTTTSSTTSTSTPGGVELQGALPATTGLFNFTPMQPGVPGADTRCNVEFPGTHACTHAELLIAETAGDLVGLQDVNSVTVTSFWLIDATHANTAQCNLTPMGAPARWQYATVHTGVGGERLALNNGTGDLGATTSGLICFQSSWVGCCL